MFYTPALKKPLVDSMRLEGKLIRWLRSGGRTTERP